MQSTTKQISITYVTGLVNKYRTKVITGIFPRAGWTTQRPISETRIQDKTIDWYNNLASSIKT